MLTTISADEHARAVDEAARFLEERWCERPRLGIILGSGLNQIADVIRDSLALPYSQIPWFRESTAVGHRGQFVCGTVGGVAVVAMVGRFHRYEGYPAWQIALPVRVMSRLGIEMLIVSNAAGAVNPHYRVGDVVAIEDHINLTWANPLIGETSEALGNRWPDMSAPYSAELIDRAQQIARREGFVCHRGVYIALSGPSYETRAEYRFLRSIGGDVVGMSTVPEVLVANQLGLRVLGLSTVTNVCLPDAPAETDGDDVVMAASQAEPKLRAIVLGVINDVARRQR